jgi:hypothetical protein
VLGEDQLSSFARARDRSKPSLGGRYASAVAGLIGGLEAFLVLMSLLAI